MNVLVAGGFGNGRYIARTLARNIEPMYEGSECIPATFSKLERLHRTGGLDQFISDNEIDRADAHSAGVLRLIGCAALSHIVAYNPPLPQSRWELLKRTLHKTVRMVKDSRELGRAHVLKYFASALGDLALHPVSNLRPFINGEISRFDSIAELSAEDDIVYTTHDEYYGELAEYEDVVIVPGGRHDELYFDPNYAAYI